VRSVGKIILPYKVKFMGAAIAPHFVDAKRIEYGKEVSHTQYWSIESQGAARGWREKVPSHWMPLPEPPSAR
jgi:Protein of unknown function (DUF551)